ncbi:MAG TPA: glycosyltransferase family 39 protein [Vitreimonas sp.]|nr:glycosyltransferase family 39 protein [Vitreimonas sp.]
MPFRTLLSQPLIFSLILFLVFQLPVFNKALSYRDEGFAINNAHLILDGKLPYRDFMTPIAPASYYFQAGLMKVFGEVFLVGRVSYVVMTLLLLTLVYISTPYLKLSRLNQLLVLSGTALMWVWPGGFAFYNTYALVFIMAALLQLLRLMNQSTSPRARRLQLFMLGVTLALVMLSKQTYGLLIVPAVVALIVSKPTFNDRWQLAEFKKSLVDAIWVMGGVIFILVLVGVYFATQGALDELLYYCFLFSVSVKAHAVAFLRNRMIFSVLIIAATAVFMRLKNQYRAWLLLIAVAVITLYLGNNPRRIGRLFDYLGQSLFYYHSVVFLTACVSVALTGFWSRSKNYVVWAWASLLLMTYFGSIASGYESAAIILTAPLLLPLVVDWFQKTPWAEWHINLNCAALVVLYTLPFLIGPVREYTLFFGVYRLPETVKSAVPSLTGLHISPREEENFIQLRTYLMQYSDIDETLVCLPYCPLINFILEMPSSSFDTLFYHETFRAQDQTRMIIHLETEQTTYIVVQKPGYVEPEADLDKQRLAELFSYIDLHYVPVLETADFRLLKRVSN